MSNKQSGLARYIEEKRAEGKTDTQITHDLLDAGWHMDIIQKSIKEDHIKHRSLEPILDIKNQPYRKSIIIILPIVVFVALIALALFA